MSIMRNTQQPEPPEGYEEEGVYWDILIIALVMAVIGILSIVGRVG